MLFLRALSERTSSLLSAGTGLGILALLFVYTYETVTHRFDNIEAFAERIPSAFESVLGNLAAIGDPAGWLGFELFELLFPLVVIILGILAGGSMLGDEEKQGTLELLLATPVRRSRVIIEKICALAVYLGGISFGVWLGVWIGTLIHDFDVNLANVAWAAVAGWLLGLFFTLLTFSVHALFGRKNVALGIGAGVAFLTYFGNVLIKLSGEFEMLRYASPFHYYKANDILLSGPDSGDYTFFVGFLLLFIVIALIGFQYRDLRT